MFNWILSKIFPPRISKLQGGGMHESFAYLERIARKHLPENKQTAARLVGKAEERRIIHLPGRVV